MMADTKQWYAIKVKWRGEKSVLTDLMKKSISAYLPIRTNIRLYARKRVTSRIPILPCYVFVYISQSDCVRVLETNHVYHFVKNGKDLQPVRDNEIQLLKQIEGIEESINVTEIPMIVGQSVKIGYGPLYGMSGVIDQVRSKGKVVVCLESLGVSLKIEVESKLLQADLKN